VQRDNITVQFVPGLSFLDQILAALPASIGPNGFAVHDATYLFHHRPPLHSSAYLFIAQIGGLGLWTAVEKSCVSEEMLRAFTDWLSTFYEKDHIAFLCDIMPAPEQSRTVKICLSRLCDYGAGLTFATTLCIPPTCCAW
jgi:hypothetical protein